VGGIAFETVATLPRALSSGSFKLDYRVGAPDGRRASISTKGRRYAIRLFDWQLQPIAEFADSDYTGVVTLFGDGPDKDFYYVNYHEAFINRLIGLRLLQADMILMDPQMLSQMPVEDNGTTEIGRGEVLSTNARRIAAAKHIKAIMSKSHVDSWVLTDIDVPLSVSLSHDSVVIDHRPYYYFWRAEPSSFPVDQRLLDQLTGQNHTYLSTKLLNELLSSRHTSPTVSPQTDVTRAIDSKWGGFMAMNRPVYESVLNTSRYSAFFRALKGANAEQWRRFMTLISKINLRAVETPNEIPMN
jgi:hypothetical protein